jgi:hypothetical protein
MVVIGGEAVYGDPQLAEQTGWHGGMEPVEVCGVKKSLKPKTVPDAINNYQAMWKELDGALSEWGRRLAPLAECGQ